MGHNEQPPARGVPNGNETAFANRVIGIIKGRGERIIEDGDSLVERNTVPPEVLLCLRTIPLELHRAILRDGVF